jgi:ankyrin repeat protein
MIKDDGIPKFKKSLSATNLERTFVRKSAVTLERSSTSVEKYSSIFEIIKKNKLEELKNILARKTAPKYLGVQDSDGKIALHHTVELQRYDMCVLLLKHGSRLTVEDNDGNTPLIIACIWRNYDIAKLLLENGGKSNLFFSKNSPINF